MTTEEKAKAYDEALTKAKILLNCKGIGDTVDLCTHLFPELKESEDERIIRAIIDALYSHTNSINLLSSRGYQMEDIEAWLEKQKEQKPEHFDLKAGKWYICHRAFCCRADHLTVKEGERFMCEKDGIVKGFVIKEPEKYFKECSAPAPMEDEQKEQKPVEIHIDNPNIEKFDPDMKITISDSSADGDELLYVCNKSYKIGYRDGKRDAEQKPAEWSEEDKKTLLSIINAFRNGTVSTIGQEQWLKNLPERFSLHTKQEWSKEDEKTINDACCWIAEYAGYLMDKNYSKASMLMSLTDKLKSLRPQPHWKPSEEQIYSLGTVVKGYNECTVGSVGYNLKELYNNLKKLM